MKRWFNYEGLDTKGRDVTGAVEAATFSEADALVRQRGVQPARVFEMDRVRVIERSLACFACGWLSLLPVLGIFAAIRGMILYHRARNEAGREWNPAGCYLACGFALAWLGSLVSVLSAGILFVLLIQFAETL